MLNVNESTFSEQYVVLFLDDFPACGKAVCNKLSLGKQGFILLSSHLFVLEQSQKGSVLGCVRNHLKASLLPADTICLDALFCRMDF